MKLSLSLSLSGVFLSVNTGRDDVAPDLSEAPPVVGYESFYAEQGAMPCIFTPPLSHDDDDEEG